MPSIIAQPNFSIQQESSHFDVALSLAIDLASEELDYHVEQARRHLAIAHSHIILAKLADSRRRRLERRIPEGAI